MGFFKDLNDDLGNNADDLVNVSTDEDVDASLIESLLEGGSGSDDIAVVDETYDIDDIKDQAAGGVEEASFQEEASQEEPVLDETVQTVEEEPVIEESEPVIQEAPVEVSAAPVEESAAYENERKYDSNIERSKNLESADDQVTVITKGTTINGSIVSDCSLNVMGTINGDIECVGKLTISGNVAGNSTASDVFVSAKRLNGNIDSEGTVKVGLGTVVIGDIKAGSAVIAGAVKGELDIQGPVVIDSTAIIKGNVKAKAVQMNNGAILEGFCSLVYSSVSVDDIFE